MAWIKMRTDLARDPAVIQLAEAYGWPEHVIVGLLHKLWSWADEQLEDGNAPSVTESFIDRYMGVTDFANNLSKVGWLDINRDGKGGIAIPNWERHMSQSAKRRGLTADRVAANRAKKCNASSVTSALPDKRREDKSTKESTKESQLALLEQEFLSAWNATPGVRQIRQMTPARRKSFKARLESEVAGEPWLDALREALGKFPLKCTTGENGWKPDGDWILKPDSLVKILEGRYDWQKEAAGARPQKPASQASQEWEEETKRQLERRRQWEAERKNG